MPSPRCWNSRRQRKFSKTLYFKTAESEGNKWCSTSLKVLKIIRLPFQDRNILTWCSIWTKEWKSESKANLSSLDVGEAFSSQPIFFFINSLHLQNLTLYHIAAITLFVLLSPLTGINCWSNMLMCHNRDNLMLLCQTSTHWSFFPTPILFFLCLHCMVVFGIK